ncbi:GMC family oxidoreductase [Pedobacter frigidisoli]|uniref:GMC family oxidoreductase n=1 Tax=Pedobacter frigidisoli TaxID=2530455 RepID=A0A4R0P2M8_9SPHI|nr:GMC family oxidoreductase [Pedobacter frigidisoli]TCD08258.1 GMC family oxidoreductase [Pedobacter frigidisoli]
MIIDPTKIESDRELDFDICIIGSGAAGISMALDFIDTKFKVALITGGNEKETSVNKDLYKGFVPVEGNHEALEENRRRQFGGSTAVWGGRCVPFDAIDFEYRPWLPNSGWPIIEDELKLHISKALDLCDAGDFNFDARKVFTNTQSEIIETLDNEDIYSWPLERYSTPTRFATKFKKTLKEAKNITVFLNTHVTKINVSDKNPSKIDRVFTITGKKKNAFKAKHFILATGGIENARLLLASRSITQPNGLGNNYDNVGRYYMCHLKGTFSKVIPRDRQNLLYTFERDANGVYCRRRWWISPEAQLKNEIGNIIFFLDRPLDGLGEKDPVFSVFYTAKMFRELLKQKSPKLIVKKLKSVKSILLLHFKTSIKYGVMVLPEIIKLLKIRLNRRRLPEILPPKNAKSFHLYFQSEHLPNRESRIRLSAEKDANGVPRPSVSIKFTEQDVDTIVKAHKIFVDRFKEMNLGQIYFDEEALRNYINDRIKNFDSAAHHLGTTRMANNPEDGVVDANCKVHGLTNIYIAGSSVFPTGSHANPTLMIVALALRLSNHIKNLG